MKNEDYWSLTLEYSDIYGIQFNNVLDIIIKYIDQNKLEEKQYESKYYTTLQLVIGKIYEKKDEASTRKSINQFIKLGFVNFQLKGYHKLAKDFLLAKSNTEKKIIFSKIVYENSSFNRSVTNYSNKREINFLLKTLAYSGPLSREDIIALMKVDISCIERGFLTRKELESQKQYIDKINFKDRKYNQISYLGGVLKELEDIYYVDSNLYMTEDEVPFSEVLVKRDPYLHRLYKAELKEESKTRYSKTICVLEKLEYPSLIASHIKPFIKSNTKEQYDKNNGLLLSRNMDSLFDKGYISFKDDGRLIFSSKLPDDVKNNIAKMYIDAFILNEDRKKYLEYHRTNVLVN